MKIEIFNEPDKSLEKTVRLGLVRKSDLVYLAVVDEFGEPVEFGYLLRFHENGSISASCGIDKSFGLNLDIHGRLAIDN